ncbi:hypothetical protein QE152_g29400 [Popillia japonica]|uniref:Uncharacterized protein n=1 Tax=Popillia japonica TaxID=7064 RepID=A0AAW1JI91_POPJA
MPLALVRSVNVNKAMYRLGDMMVGNRDAGLSGASKSVTSTVQCGKLKSNKAPGPGNIPPEILKRVAAERPDIVLGVMNFLAGKANFPAEWKKKTEAVLLTTKRKNASISFEVHTKQTFAEHVNKTTEKAEKTSKALTKLMPNIGRPRTSKRRILVSVMHFQLLYVAPVWHRVTSNMKLTRKLAGIQWLASIRICSAYRTISTRGGGVIAGLLPIELLIEERKSQYEGELSGTPVPMEDGRGG